MKNIHKKCYIFLEEYLEEYHKFLIALKCVFLLVNN